MGQENIRETMNCSIYSSKNTAVSPGKPDFKERSKDIEMYQSRCKC